jgi:hypothetical protein
LAKRSSLALAGAVVFEQRRQTFELSENFRDFAFEADTVKAWCFSHTSTVAANVFFSCASLPRKRVDFEETGRGLRFDLLSAGIPVG